MNQRTAPPKNPADLAHYALIHLDDPRGVMPWLNWPAWLAGNVLSDLQSAGALRFSLYDQVIQATLAGQGVTLGRIPLIAKLLNDGRLAAPFARRYDSPRGCFGFCAPHAQARAEAIAFIDWFHAEAKHPSIGAARTAKARRA